MKNAGLDEAQAGIKISRRNINNLRCADDTTLWPFATPKSPWNSPGQNTGVGSLSLLQGIFPTQGSNPGLPHCRQILYQLNHKGQQK